MDVVAVSAEEVYRGQLESRIARTALAHLKDLSAENILLSLKIRDF